MCGAPVSLLLSVGRLVQAVDFNWLVAAFDGANGGRQLLSGRRFLACFLGLLVSGMAGGFTLSFVLFVSFILIMSCFGGYIACLPRWRHRRVAGGLVYCPGC